jgi:hypothetical protein
MTKEQIIQILQDSIYYYEGDELVNKPIGDIADEILALHRCEFPMAELVDTDFDVPSKNDLAIEIIARYTTQTSRGTDIERRGFIKGATWAIETKLERNKK